MATDYQIFISYAHEDTARVKVIYERLQSAGYQPWLD
ncbi:MAG: toll/interleukin-1 receptor domain-containing protein, partial [Acidobacteriota bacterium]